MGLHFMIVQIVAAFFSAAIMALGKGGGDFYEYLLLINGTAGAAVIPIAYFFYIRDKNKRGVALGKDFSWKTDAGLLFLLGAGLGQTLNYLLAFLQVFQLFDGYSETVGNLLAQESMWSMILWSGIIAPFSEELIFRGLIFQRLRDYQGFWLSAIVSAAIFGIYHGNVVQFIYATILGIAFAALVEMTGSLWAGIFLHMGANIWSVIQSHFATYILEEGSGMMLYLGMLGLMFLLMLVIGMFYIRKAEKKYRER